MAIQDQTGVTSSQGGLPLGDGVSLISGSLSVSRIQLNDQFSYGNDHAPKVRKPYTITKQRERWTDEEHKKFLEALKLYGRAWRRIEEHVGTKTAVQIRSHAQKFFSKVLRDTNGSSTSLVESIAIPPPRPKRKPMHPYPRKLVEIPKKEISDTEQLLCSNSLKSSDFDQENNSPKSVLSAVVSETLGSSESDTPTRSLSPVSSDSGVHNSGIPIAEPKTSFEEDGTPPPARLNDGSTHDEQPLAKLNLFHKESISTKDEAAEESSGRTVKLFGTTLLVTDPCLPSSPIAEACKPIPGVYLKQLENRNSDIVEGPAATAPWWAFSYNRPFMALHKDPEGKHVDSNLVEFEDKEVQKELSWTGSNTSSVHEGENNEESDDQAKSHMHCFTHSETSAISELRVMPKTFGKGFVPYKRCMAERENHYSLVTGEEREEQRIRLYL